MEGKIEADKREMKILVLGLCRTGTYSIKAALEELGFEVYHMASVWSTPGHADLWTDIFRRKFGERGGKSDGGKIGRGDFERLLGGYDVVTDIPASCFGPELIDAYPDAKIILTTREVGSWVRSMNETIWASQSDPLRPWDKLFYNPHLKSISTMMEIFFSTYFYGSFPKYSSRVFIEHNERIRNLALSLPKLNGEERFLEFQAGKQGWRELCTFLGREIPDEKREDGRIVKGDERVFPRINDSKSWREMFRTGERWEGLKRKAGWGSVVGGVAILGVLVWKRVRR